MNPAPETEWSPEVNGLRYRCGTHRRRYGPGEKIVLTAGYRNASGRPMVILVNGNNLDEPGGLLQFDQSPLYSVERITVTTESAPSQRASIRAIWSNMFHIFTYRVVQPGEEYSESALLSTPFWEAVDEHSERPAWLKPLDSRSLCLPEFPEGAYRLEAVYTQPGIPEKTLRKMRAFLQLPDKDRDVDAFYRTKIEGFSFNDFELFVKQDFNLWSGNLVSPAFVFEVTA
jgi:hypothetical protein